MKHKLIIIKKINFFTEKIEELVDFIQNFNKHKNFIKV